MLNLGRDGEGVEVRVVARLTVQAEGGHRGHGGVGTSHSGPATVNLWADAVLAMCAVAVRQTAAHLHSALYDGDQTVGVGRRSVGVAGGVVDRGGPDVVADADTGHKALCPVSRQDREGIMLGSGWA